MPLSEDQILRFSRQILLREVGGKGQQALLAAALRARGTGAAIATACAYVSAGGSKVEPGEATSSIPGFAIAPHLPLVEAGHRPTPEAIVQRPDAPLPEASVLDATVLIVADDALIAAPVGGCTACLRENVAVLASRAEEPAERRRSAELIGTLAALAHQRIVLGLERGLRRLAVEGDGTIRATEPLRCEAHR